MSENFEWRIRQHSAEQKVTKCHVLREVSGLTRVSGASRRRRTAFKGKVQPGFDTTMKILRGLGGEIEVKFA